MQRPSTTSEAQSAIQGRFHGISRHAGGFRRRCRRRGGVVRKADESLRLRYEWKCVLLNKCYKPIVRIINIQQTTNRIRFGVFTFGSLDRSGDVLLC